MIVVANILGILYIASEVYQYIFFAYIILSFFPINENNIFLRIVNKLCEPLYRNLLRILPPLRIGFLDLSPFYVVFLIWIIQYIIKSLQHRIVVGL